MALSDTSPEIKAMQIQIRRSMSVSKRLKVACDISDLAQAFRKAGIKRDHPDWSEREVTIELLRLAFEPNPLPPGLR
jgi:hypothetical protein